MEKYHTENIKCLLDFEDASLNASYLKSKRYNLFGDASPKYFKTHTMHSSLEDPFKIFIDMEMHLRLGFTEIHLRNLSKQYKSNLVYDYSDENDDL